MAPEQGGTEQMFDVAIVGAGPSGSTLAYRLARMGKGVAVLDKARFPRQKPCGGLLDAIFFEHLPHGMSAEEVIEESIGQGELWYRGRVSRVYHLANPLYLTQRTNLDQHLLVQARQAGAHVFEGAQANSFARSDGHWDVRVADGRSLQTRFLVGADGTYSTVARHLRFPLKKTPYVVVQWEVDDPRTAAWRGKAIFDVSVYPIGYGWLFKKRDHLNVGLGVPRRFGQALEARLQKCLATWGVSGPTRRYSHHVHFAYEGQVAGSDALLIGEAAGIVDPGTGGGISWGVYSAEAAAQAIVRGQLDMYQGWFQEALLPSFRASEAMRNCVVFSLLSRGSEGKTFAEMLRVVTGQQTYLGWRKEHPNLYRLGRLLRHAFRKMV